MIPGLGGMNPAQMKAMMKQFGIKSDELDVKSVIIETNDGKKIIFDSPQVTAIDMKGQKTYTIAGESREEGTGTTISEEDIELVMDQTNCSHEDALSALEESNGDLAAAISSLKNEK